MNRLIDEYVDMRLTMIVLFVLTFLLNMRSNVINML